MTNCYEAINEMKKLSDDLEVLLNNNFKMNGKLDGGIDNIEREFLIIKHSLDLIPVKGYNKSAYQLGLDLVACKTNLYSLLDKKQHEENKKNRRILGHRIDQLEAKYLELEKILKKTPYIKNFMFL